MRRSFFLLAFCFGVCTMTFAQSPVSPTPPMGFLSWSLFAENVNEESIKSIADAMVATGLRDAGYDYIVIDDAWQGGRDHKNRLIPDPKKFPSGMKALCDYLHQRKFKVGIYSDVAPLTCAGYTGSLHFEELDVKTFAAWGFDYMKIDYCGAPEDAKTAQERYKKIADAIAGSGRPMVLSVCEWGDRKPWLWAGKIGGQLWRTTADIRDKWVSAVAPQKPSDLHRLGAGILDVVNINGDLHKYAGVNRWNDPDMLVIGLYGGKGQPTTDLGGKGCTDEEYRSQMSLWSLMASPLMVSCDVRSMNEVTKSILMNKDVIAINQDALGQQAKRVVKNDELQIFVKPLANGDVALGVLNVASTPKTVTVRLADVGITGKRKAVDLWSKKKFTLSATIKVEVKPHETKIYRLAP